MTSVQKKPSPKVLPTGLPFLRMWLISRVVVVGYGSVHTLSPRQNLQSFPIA
jgi:hypothetical protein